MTDLSPAAQAVLDAFLGDCANTGLQMDDLRENVAAALRAAADQVAPERYSCYTGNSEFDFGLGARHDAIREDLLAIAAELEAQ
jgi:hypothetical protein